MGLVFSLGVSLVACGSSVDLDDPVALPEREPAAPVLAFRASPIKRFDFTWSASDDVEAYALLESSAPGQPLLPIATDLTSDAISLVMPLHLRDRASYVLSACNDLGCTDSAPLVVSGPLLEAIGYFKASHPRAQQGFGYDVALSRDGSTLAVAAPRDDSGVTGTDVDPNAGSAVRSGVIHVFVRDDAGGWSQQAYVKASDSRQDALLGISIALDRDGNTLAASASGRLGAVKQFRFDWDAAVGVDRYELLESASPGWPFVPLAVDLEGESTVLEMPLHLRSGAQYSLRACHGADCVESAPVSVVGSLAEAVGYVKASNTGVNDWFGLEVALSGDGRTLAVGAPLESSSATGIDGEQDDELAVQAGAVYVFVRDAVGQWSQQAYVKASNAGSGDRFGWCLALSIDGLTLAIGARWESSASTGIGGDQEDDSAPHSGAVYLY
jgi:hypothetical protein